MKDVSDLQAEVGREHLLERLNANLERLENASLPKTRQSESVADTLSRIGSFLRRYIVFPKEAHITTISLWIAHTWAIEAFEYTPYLNISSPLKRCGKSRVLDCLLALSRNPWAVVSPTEAVLYRKIEMDCPTLLLDEVDTIYTGKGDDNKEGLRALLNAGFERRAVVPRCVGPKHELTHFKVFCPKALAGIGKLPDTVADRSIPILLVRRTQNQSIEKFRKRDAESIAQPIAEAIREWGESETVIAALSAARPSIPEELGDRAADICEPLLAIADMAGGDWPNTARQALVELCAGIESQDENAGVKLLNAFREIFHERNVKHISTKDALEALIARETDEPWAAWWEKDFTSSGVRCVAGKLAKLLRPFGIVAGTIREADNSTPKGYRRENFEDAFARYLPEVQPGERHNATT